MDCDSTELATKTKTYMIMVTLLEIDLGDFALITEKPKQISSPKVLSGFSIILRYKLSYWKVSLNV